MKPCCDTLVTLSDDEHVGRRGCAFLVYELGGIPFFVLQFRTVDQGNDERLVGAVRAESNARGSTMGTRISQEVAMRFCPFCGTEFKKWARRNPEGFRAIVAKSVGHVELPPVRSSHG